jgi:hypothetical protein
VQPDEMGVVPGERAQDAIDRLWRAQARQVLRTDHMMHWEKDEVIQAKKDAEEASAERARCSGGAEGPVKKSGKRASKIAKRPRSVQQVD